MQYFHTNTLYIYYTTKFLGNKVEARRMYKVAWTSLTGEKVKFVNKGDKLAGRLGFRGCKSRQNLILVDIHTSREDFIDAISKYFSELLDLNPHRLKFTFETPTPLGGDLNA